MVYDVIQVNEKQEIGDLRKSFAAAIGVLSYSRGQQFNLCYQTSISLIFCYCSGSFSASNQINAYKSSIYCVCREKESYAN